MDYEKIIELVKTKKQDWEAANAVSAVWEKDNPPPVEPKWIKMQKRVSSVVNHSQGAVWMELGTDGYDRWQGEPTFSLKLTVADKAISVSLALEDVELLRSELGLVVGEYIVEMDRRQTHRERVAIWNKASEEWRNTRETIKANAAKVWRSLKKNKKLVTEEVADDIPF